MKHQTITAQTRRSFFARMLTGAALLLAMAPSWAADLQNIPGITEPFLDVTLNASVPGIISKRRFQEGDFVKAGEAIIELDQRLEELEVERRQLVVEARRTDYQGTLKLFQTTKGTSKEEMEKKESEYKLAVVEHAMAVEQLRRRTVTAPLSGLIVELPLEAGESCQSYQPLARVVDVRRCYFVVNLEAKAAATLKLEQKISLEIDTGAGVEAVTGVMAFLSPVADPASGLIKAKALFENPAGKFRPGLSGRLQLR